MPDEMPSITSFYEDLDQMECSIHECEDEGFDKKGVAPQCLPPASSYEREGKMRRIFAACLQCNSTMAPPLFKILEEAPQLVNLSTNDGFTILAYVLHKGFSWRVNWILDNSYFRMKLHFSFLARGQVDNFSISEKIHPMTLTKLLCHPLLPPSVFHGLIRCIEGDREAVAENVSRVKGPFRPGEDEMITLIRDWRQCVATIPEPPLVDTFVPCDNEWIAWSTRLHLQ